MRNIIHDTKLKEQIKRENDIDKILRNFNEKDIPDSIIYKINNLYPITKSMNFLRTEQLQTGMIIKIVSLDLEILYSTAIIVKISETSSHKMGKILLLNAAYDTVWTINPNRFYIFQAEKGVINSYNLINKVKKVMTKQKK